MVPTGTTALLYLQKYLEKEIIYTSQIFRISLLLFVVTFYITHDLIKFPPILMYPLSLPTVTKPKSKQITGFARFLGEKTFYDIKMKEEIVLFLNTKIKVS